MVALLLVACSVATPRVHAPVLTNRPTNPTCLAPERPATRVRVVRAFPRARFDQPTSITASADGTWWFVAERRGRVYRIAADDDAAVPELVLDMSGEVDASTGAIGLLAIAAAPAATGALFASYTARGGTLVTSRLARFVTNDAGRTFERDRVLIEIDQAVDYHVNTDLRFGPDGYLYVGFGDGGPQGDPHGRAQDPRELRGKILRLDVSAPGPYRIPADNPYAAGGGAPEIWALGLRNPWRFGFDRETGELWAGDVGGDHFEEIDRIERGGNYGWPAREARRCMTPACKRIASIDPVLALPHPTISSVTFGVVYRGRAVPALRGHLVYSDYASGTIWDADPARPEGRVLDNAGRTIVSFAEDADGEPLLVDLAGTLWRLAPGDDGPADVPALLTSTGCFSRGAVAAPGLVPYEINQAFWSDGGVKRRWLAVPDGQRITVDRDGHLQLPIGSVAIKEFSIGGVRVETRLLARHTDGDWAGYTYRWNRDQTDAVLVPASAQATNTTWPLPWLFPHRGECTRCHQSAAGHTLGLEVAQLARDVGGTNQLATFQAIGLLDMPAAPDEHVALRPEGTVEERARAWLHANCAYCHRPGGTGQGDLDLRHTTPLAEMGVCNVPPRFGTFGQDGALLVAPGDPARSMLLRRMRALGFLRMPPLGTRTADTDGIALVERWIAELRCP